MKIFREEHFGGVLYDTDTLRFELVPSVPDNVDITLKQNKPPLRTDIPSAPVRSYFELTRQCTQSCKHCFVSSSPKAPMGLATDQLEKIIDELTSSRVIDVRFTGGELTTRPDWFEVLSYAKNNGLQISVNTNGVYKDQDEVVKKMKELDPNQVTISIDGNSGHHNFMRGPHSYESAIDTLKKMSSLGIKTRTNTVLTKLNVGDIPQIIEEVSPYVAEMNFFHMRPVGRGINQNKLSMQYDDHFESARDTIALKEKYPNLSIMHFEQSYRERAVSKSDVTVLEDSLSHGTTTINIDCFGGVWPNGYNTYQDERMYLGNLLTETLDSIWNENQTLDAIRDWFRAILKNCQGCGEYLQKCPGLSPEMEIANQSHGIKNNFCISETPMPVLFDKTTK
ncbi:radical SAM protein [Candidatus Woesearchaeota archaeon]|nr:radical SAM protein [Candidatus Woesearchaeota archaeon]